MKIKREYKRSAYDYSLHLLKFSNKSVSEIKQRLAIKSYPARDIEHAVNKLKKYKILNEELSVMTLCRSRIERGLSNQMIKTKLLQKGYPLAIIEKHINALDKAASSEMNRSISCAEKRMRLCRDFPPEKLAYTLQSYLYRKGYSHEIIQGVMVHFKLEEIS